MHSHLLIRALVAASGKSTLSIATEIGGQSFQGTLHKYISGKVLNPRHETAQKLAKYFDLPLQAMYDGELALQIAGQRGVTIPRSWRADELTAEERKPAYSLTKPKEQALSAATLKRIGKLTPKQRKALEGMIEVWLDSIAPAEPDKRLQA